MDDFQNLDLKALARKTLIKYDFQIVFSDEVINELEALDFESLFKSEAGKVVDLRDLLWSSIDNYDSLDLDQVEYCQRDANNEINVKVAIADVDLFAPKGSSVDNHAYQNTTSIYTDIEMFPMIPTQLSTNFSSLNVGQDRLAIIIEFSALPDGGIRGGRIYRAVVRNKIKLVYEVIGPWLEGNIPTPACINDIPGLENQIKLQDEAAQRLGTRRVKKGSLELGTIESKAVIKDEKVTDMILVENNRAHELIENFMVGANGVVSDFLEEAKMPIIQRVVEIPRYWNEIVDVAKKHGTNLPTKPNSIALSEFLKIQKLKDPLRFPDLSLTIIKLLGAGKYVMLEPNAHHVGHFCLAATDYTHSTAPNRRYVDLVIQRILKAELEKLPCPYTTNELSEIAEWCNLKEKNSKKVERFMKKAQACNLLFGKIGEKFEGIVTGASKKGTWVRLMNPPTEGKIIRGMEGLKVGQKVKVKLININPNKGYIDFERYKKSDRKNMRYQKHKNKHKKYR